MPFAAPTASERKRSWTMGFGHETASLMKRFSGSKNRAVRALKIKKKLDASKVVTLDSLFTRFDFRFITSLTDRRLLYFLELLTFFGDCWIIHRPFVIKIGL